MIRFDFNLTHKVDLKSLQYHQPDDYDSDDSDFTHIKPRGLTQSFYRKIDTISKLPTEPVGDLRQAFWKLGSMLDDIDQLLDPISVAYKTLDIICTNNTERHNISQEIKHHLNDAKNTFKEFYTQLINMKEELSAATNLETDINLHDRNRMIDGIDAKKSLENKMAAQSLDAQSLSVEDLSNAESLFRTRKKTVLRAALFGRYDISLALLDKLQQFLIQFKTKYGKIIFHNKGFSMVMDPRV